MARSLSSRLRPALVGRADERRRIHALLDDGAPLVTLTGPGGVGKTALASVVADERGAVFVDLAAARAPHDLGRALVAALGGGSDDADAFDRAARVVAGLGQTLLVLDNLEAGLQAAEPLRRLLESAPELSLLCTSQTPLRLSFEQVVPVGPLPAADAVDLFCTCARRAGLDVDAAARAAAVALVARLDGLPLAIELAAARAPALGMGGLVALVAADDFDLGKGAADLPERHRSLDAAVAGSVGLLDDDARGVLDALAVCAGSVDVDAVAAVADVDAGVAAAAMAALVDAALVQRTVGGLSLLAPLRAAVRRRLAPAAQAALFERHAAVFARGGPAERLAIVRRGAAPDASPGLLQSALEALQTLPPLAIDDGSEERLRGRLTGSAAGLSAGLRAGALTRLAERAWLQGRHAVALDDVAAIGADRPGRARVIAARAAFALGRFDDALAAAASVDVADLVATAGALLVQGSVFQSLHRLDEARGALLQAGALARRHGDAEVEAQVEASLGTLALDVGAVAEARERLAATLALARRHGLERSAHVSAAYAALAAAEAGDAAAAAALVDEAAAGALRSNNRMHQAIIGGFVAVVAAASDDADEAAAALAAARAIELPPSWGRVLDLCAAHVAAARARACAAAGDVAGAARARASAEDAFAASAAGAADSDDVRILRRQLERVLLRSAPTKLPARRVLVLGKDLAWFAVDGGARVDLTRRRLLRVLLGAIAGAVEPIGFAALVRLAWPGEERLPVEVHKNRLHVALSSLRSLGLRDVIAHVDHGWRVADGVTIERF